MKKEKMTIKTVKVSDKGQIAIPTAIREKMGINKGDELILFQIDGKILLEKPKRISKEVEDNFKDLLVYSEKTIKKVWDNEEDEIWDTYLEDES